MAETGVTIRLRADAGFALPLLYKFCEFFGIHYTIGIPANVVFRRRTAALQRRWARRGEPNYKLAAARQQ